MDTSTDQDPEESVQDEHGHPTTAIPQPQPRSCFSGLFSGVGFGVVGFVGSFCSGYVVGKALATRLSCVSKMASSKVT